MERRVHIFQAPKGGVSCTTTAIGFACWLAETRNARVLCVCNNDDGSAILHSPDEPYASKVTLECWKDYMTDNRWSTEHAEYIAYQYAARLFDFVVLDFGTFGPRLSASAEWQRHLVVDNHYPAIKRAITKFDHGNDFDDFVLFEYPDSSLEQRDVAVVLKPLNEFMHVKWDIAVARTIDAGLFPRHAQTHNYAPTQLVP